MKKYILFFAGCIIIATMGFSQEDKSTKITIFKPEDNKPTTIGALPKQQDVQCVKWNYSLLARGIFLMNYEYQLQKKLSAEVGLGITYRDFIFEATHGTYFDNFSFNASYNFCAEGGVRFYPKGFDNFEGFYLSPIISYRKYSLSMPDGYSNTTYINTISSFKPGYNFLDIQLKFGFQYESLWNTDLLSDFYVGVSLRNVTVNYYSANSNAATGGTNYVSTQKQDQFPQFLLGFKFGIPF